MNSGLNKAYEYIINHGSIVATIDCDSTIIGSKKTNDGKILTSGECSTDAAFSLEKRLNKKNISKKINKIAQKSMNKKSVILKKTLNSILSIFIKYGLTRKDILKGAKEAILEDGFSDYIILKKWLKKEQKLKYEQIFFLSGGFREMIEVALKKIIGINKLKNIFFSNEFKYTSDGLVIGWDKDKSLMYSQTAKKDMVNKLKKEGLISKKIKISGLGDGLNDISMSDKGLFVAYTGVKRRKNVIQKSSGVEAINFYEVSVFHTSPEEKKLILNNGTNRIRKTLLKGIKSLEGRMKGINIIR